MMWYMLIKANYKKSKENPIFQEDLNHFWKWKDTLVESSILFLNVKAFLIVVWRYALQKYTLNFQNLKRSISQIKT